MQSFGEHGRELITPEVGLRLLELLGQLGSEMEHSTEAVTPQQTLLQRTVFKVGLQHISAKQAATEWQDVPSSSMVYKSNVGAHASNPVLLSICRR